MDAAAGAGMLTACLAVGGLLIRIAVRADAHDRRRYPPQPQPPEPLKRDPRARSSTEVRELFTKQPSMPDTEPSDAIPPQPEDAVPPKPEPTPHQPGIRSAAELHDLFRRQPESRAG